MLGAPFYLMEQVEGVVVRDALPAWLDEPRRHALGLDLATAFAEVHRADPQPFVDAGLGRPNGYLARQLRRWTGQREGIQAAVAAAGGRARDAARLRPGPRLAGAPTCRTEAAPAVVHGDAKLDNVVVGAGGDPGASPPSWTGRWPPSATRGPTWATCCRSGRSPARRTRWPGWWPTGEGFPSRGELVAAWEHATGRTAGDLRWFVTLADWKLAVLLEASYHRHLAGSTDDPFFATLERGVPALLARARETCGG